MTHFGKQRRKRRAIITETKNKKSSLGIILLRMELYSMVINLIKEIEERTKLCNYVVYRYFHSFVE